LGGKGSGKRASEQQIRQFFFNVRELGMSKAAAAHAVGLSKAWATNIAPGRIEGFKRSATVAMFGAPAGITAFYEDGPKRPVLGFDRAGFALVLDPESGRLVRAAALPGFEDIVDRSAAQTEGQTA
jgi:hypothetical protein